MSAYCLGDKLPPPHPRLPIHRTGAVERLPAVSVRRIPLLHCNRLQKVWRMWINSTHAGDLGIAAEVPRLACGIPASHLIGTAISGCWNNAQTTPDRYDRPLGAHCSHRQAARGMARRQAAQSRASRHGEGGQDLAHYTRANGRRKATKLGRYSRDGVSRLSFSQARKKARG